MGMSLSDQMIAAKLKPTVAEQLERWAGVAFGGFQLSKRLLGLAKNMRRFGITNYMRGAFKALGKYWSGAGEDSSNIARGARYLYSKLNRFIKKKLGTEAEEAGSEGADAAADAAVEGAEAGEEAAVESPEIVGTLFDMFCVLSGIGVL